MASPVTYRYPLHEEGDYKGRIRFTLIREEETAGTSISELLAPQKSDLQRLQAEAAEARKKGDEDLYQQKSDEIEELRKDLDSFNGSENQTITAGTRKVADTQIVLYLPPGLAFRDNVVYENVDLGASGAAVAQGGAAGAAQGLTEGISSFINAMGANSGASNDLGKLAAVQAAGKFGKFSDEVKAGIKLSSGVTTNPNTRVLFKQVNIREFAFAFKFYARSAEEAGEINNIIKFFRTELYPEDIPLSVGGVDISVGYRFPNKFQIGIEYDGENQNVPKLKPCFLKDVSTTFNASNMAMHSDGNFTEIDMSLSFQETVTLSKTDIEEGF